jgi:predicted HTH domain antitoxin
MTITIPDAIATHAGLDEKEALKELALSLFAQQKITGSEARRLSGASFFQFEEWRKDRNLPIREFTLEELESDIATLRSLGVL